MKITLALLSLAIAAVSTSASAQTTHQQIWDACCKTHHAKTNPAVPVAPSVPPENPSSREPVFAVGEIQDLVALIDADKECARQFAGRGQQVINACVSAVMKRRDSDKIDTVHRRTR